MSTSGHSIRSDVVDETVRLLAAANEAGVLVRALGGVAIVLHAGDDLHPALKREIRDIDLATSKREGRKLTQFLVAEGYTADREFNGLQGARRLLFYDEPNERHIDVFVETFAMCHELPLGDRLAHDQLTLPLAELLLTKLQIVKLNRKDAYDVYALLLTHEVADHDEDAINARRVAELCANDWGLYRTFQLNVERLREELEGPQLGAAELESINRRLSALARAVEGAPKGSKWKLRARVGDRVRWYEDPDEVDQTAH
jgi:hypothetical protein